MGCPQYPAQAFKNFKLLTSQLATWSLRASSKSYPPILRWFGTLYLHPECCWLNSMYWSITAVKLCESGTLNDNTFSYMKLAMADSSIFLSQQFSPLQTQFFLLGMLNPKLFWGTELWYFSHHVFVKLLSTELCNVHFCYHCPCILLYKLFFHFLLCKNISPNERAYTWV